MGFRGPSLIYVTARGGVARGYNPTGSPTPSVIPVQLHGGGGLPNLVGPVPMGARLRFTKDTLTPELRNVYRRVLSVEENRFTLVAPFPCVGFADDHCVYEMPG